MDRQIALFSLVFSTIIYTISGVISFLSTWQVYNISQDSSQGSHPATIIDMVGNSLAIMLLLSTIVASWRLFGSDRYSLAIIISLFPIGLYAFMRAIPLLLN